MSDIVEIDYQFNFINGLKINIPLKIDDKTAQTVVKHPDDLPKWTALEFNQCKNCPLTTAQQANCPLAVQLLNIVENFNQVQSTDEVNLEVTTPSRKIIAKTTAQNSVSSLMGLIMATSGCPHTSFFRPMARFHLPLAEIEETIYRATSNYLLSQYFKFKKGKEVSFEMDGLVAVYENMQIINQGMAKRLKVACKEDSSVNAVIILDMFAQNLSILIEESLEEIENLYDSYLELG
ncbi:MAG: hypothetical protein HN826_02760 [Methylococcales bacterium]|jgi:hypothetical protein|nr:hypothetical protein [Methylococcales bacterium]